MVYPPVPPEGRIFTAPLESPLQFRSVGVTDAVKSVGSLIVKFAVVVHNDQLLSVIVQL